MSLTVGELNAVLGLDQGPFDRGLRQSEGRFGGFGTALAGMAKKAAIGTSVALAGGAVAGVKSFADLERGMNEVFTLMPGISDKAMGKMTGQVKDFSTEFGTLPNEVVPALYQSLSAGVPPGNVFDFMETAQKAATGGVTDLTTAVDGITSVVNAYGDQIGGATEASDLMFTAVRLGKTNFEELSASLSNVTPIASANGVAFGDVTAALATMTAQGIPTAQATTQIRQAIVELSDSGSEVGKTFEEVAGKSFREFMAEGGSMSEALGILEQGADDSGVSIDQLFGSVEAGGAALALSGDNADKFAANVDEMAGSAGATEAAYDQMDQGISRSFDKIKAAGAVALTNVGESLAPLVASMAGWAEDTLPKVAQAVGPAIQQALTTANTVISTATQLWANFKIPILAVAAVIAASYIPKLVASTVATVTNLATQGAAWVAARGRALASIATQVAAMGKLIARYAWMGVQSLVHAAKVAASWVVAMGPVGWVIAAVVGLVALIIANWDKVKEWTGKIWSWVSDKVASAWQWVQDKTRAAVDAVVRFVGNLRDKAMSIIRAIVDFVKTYHPIMIMWRLAKEWVPKVISWFVNLKDRAVGLVTGLRDRVVSLVTGLRDRAVSIVATLVVGYVNAVTGLRDKVVALFTALKDRAVSIVTGLKDAVVNRITSLMDRVRGIKDQVVGFFAGAGSWLINAGKSIIRGLVSGIGSMASAPVDAVKGIVGKVRNLLPGSPVKDGPLKVLNRGYAGGQIVKMLADGMGAEVGSLSAMADRAARAAMPDVGAVNVPRIAGGQQFASASGGGDSSVNGAGSSDGRMIRDGLKALADAMVRRGLVDEREVAALVRAS